MQTVMSGGIQVIELIPGAVLRAAAMDGGAYALLSLDRKEGNVAFAGSSTIPTGSATAGPFNKLTNIRVEAKGRVSLATTAPHAVARDMVSEAILGSDGKSANTSISSITYSGGRVTSYVEGGTTWTITYGGSGQVTSISNGVTSRTINYNGDGSVASIL